MKFVLVVCVQVDNAGNVQPHDMDHVWNFRGVNNTCWHRVKVKLKQPCVPCSSQTGLLTLQHLCTTFIKFSLTDYINVRSLLISMNLTCHCKKEKTVGCKGNTVCFKLSIAQVGHSQPALWCWLLRLSDLNLESNDHKSM